MQKTSVMGRLESLDNEKLGFCPVHKDQVNLYVCEHVGCKKYFEYYCTACSEEDDTVHNHKISVRDKVANKLAQAFLIEHNKVENLHENASEKFDNFKTVILFCSKKKAFLNLPGDSP